MIPFEITDWKAISETEHKGDTGSSFWKTLQYPGLRIRVVEYKPGYLADHWCQKGHIVYCLEGEFTNQLENGPETILKEGMSYTVSDGLSSHRSYSENGCKLLIVDGDFLRSNNLHFD